MRLERIERVPVDEILDLLEACLGPGSVPRSEAFWRWKHEMSPFGVSPGFAAFSGSRLVGVRVFMRWRWREGEHTWESLRAVDTATHPASRRQGVFRLLTTRLLEEVGRAEYDFVFNTPNTSSGAGYRRMGWQSLGRAPVLVRPLRPLALLRGLRPRPATAHRGIWSPSKLAPLADSWSKVEGPPPSVSRLLTTEARGRYLRWRYLEPPELDYRGASAGSTRGILRPTLRSGLRELALCELWPGVSTADRRGFFRQIFGSGADYVTAVAARGTPTRRLLLRWGFLPASPFGPHVVLKPISDRSLQPTTMNRWAWTLGDLELF